MTEKRRQYLAQKAQEAIIGDEESQQTVGLSGLINLAISPTRQILSDSIPKNQPFVLPPIQRIFRPIGSQIKVTPSASDLDEIIKMTEKNLKESLNMSVQLEEKVLSNLVAVNDGVSQLRRQSSVDNLISHAKRQRRK